MLDKLKNAFDNVVSDTGTVSAPVHGDSLKLVAKLSTAYADAAILRIHTDASVISNGQLQMGTEVQALEDMDKDLERMFNEADQVGFMNMYEGMADIATARLYVFEVKAQLT